ncbi:Oidioi.mRNA.OKI2018_I69.chr1.g834.t1.cds [Oikopleura dioica]|uniref:Oidioi.mRNA.OKI2018_I69.chr1.g834.t1.cds n=1 Tax=Oikopleura dioica TaxID=34765 RepID=A0ABN7SVB9_OIKDI|nr:Oidioi.mRNA.OKI2018_I69.chr1.g834.t1.cds [Oikopleura dioica]
MAIWNSSGAFIFSFIQYRRSLSSSKILHERDYREEIEITEIFTAPKTASKTCQKPVEDIIFVKTHKTGSSTLQNIIRRFGMKNNLPIAMPVSDGNRFEYPYFFKTTFIKKLPSGQKPRIIANHLRASRELYEIFPEAKRITILRDIPSLYESSFGYFRSITTPYRKAQSLEAFYSSPERFWNADEPYGNKGNDVFARNHMAFDLGMPWLSENNEENILQALEQTFDLVLLTDYFKESMVLLKKELCWEWEDVLFFVTNERSEKQKLSPELESKMRSWNHLDNAIYEHFSKVFWQKIDDYEGFGEDLKILEEKLDEVKKTCLEKEFICEENDLQCQFSYDQVKIKNYQLSKEGEKLELCRLMVMPELEMSIKIFESQWTGWYDLYDGQV